MHLDDLLNILACPACKGELQANNEAQRFCCHACGLEFPVREGIPVMLIDEAEKSEEQGLADRVQ
ncbi:MAG: Trm112 family protein [Pedobacter sp.]